ELSDFLPDCPADLLEEVPGRRAEAVPQAGEKVADLLGQLLNAVDDGGGEALDDLLNLLGRLGDGTAIAAGPAGGGVAHPRQQVGEEARHLLDDPGDGAYRLGESVEQRVDRLGDLPLEPLENALTQNRLQVRRVLVDQAHDLLFEPAGPLLVLA